MSEMIDRSEALKRLCAACSNMGSFACMTCVIPGIIKDTPTIEAEPVRHGRWINDTYCSECKRFPVDVSVSISNRELTKYFSRCPHCGARMVGGANNGS